MREGRAGGRLPSRKCEIILKRTNFSQVWHGYNHARPRAAYLIGCEMTRRGVDVTYASRPRFTKPLLAAPRRLLRHACKSNQTITHPAGRLSAAADVTITPGYRTAGPALPRVSVVPGPLHSAVNGTSASHLSTDRRRRVAAAAGDD